MQTFTYPLLAKFVYRYANIPVSMVLVFYLIVSVGALSISFANIIAVIINAGLLVVLNRYYFKTYKLFPYKIELTKEEIICSDFTFHDKKVIMRFDEIESISGGIFSGIRTKPIKIFDRKHKEISFSAHIRGYKELLTAILGRIRKEKYEELLGQIPETADEQRSEKRLNRN